MSKKDKSKAGNFLNKNPLEAVGDIIGGIGSSVTNDLIGAGSSDFFNQMLGGEQKKAKEERGGDLQEGEAISLRELKRASVEPGLEYRREIIHTERVTNTQNERETRVKIEEILVEIKRLMETSKDLETQFKDVAVETPVVKVGKYHESFFEWVFVMVKAARLRIEESAGWMSAMHSKKDKKYWAMFKKHGTTFGLSNERVVATQVG